MNTERVHNTKVGDAGHANLEEGKGTTFRKAATKAIHRMILQGRMAPQTQQEKDMLEKHLKNE